MLQNHNNIISVDDSESLKLYKNVAKFNQKIMNFFGAGIYDPEYKIGIMYNIIQFIFLTNLVVLVYSSYFLEENKYAALEAIATVALPIHVSEKKKSISTRGENFNSTYFEPQSCKTVRK